MRCRGRRRPYHRNDFPKPVIAASRRIGARIARHPRRRNTGRLRAPIDGPAVFGELRQWGRTRIWPGKIRSGSETTSRLRVKMSRQRFSAPSCSRAIFDRESPDLTV
ncbi:hypothetical protein SAMN05421541_12665 [Actinoplanes philippinensis]|uniref:Uncharacterized protein n=1 Tax=Actinoplanes philippinensis TaxID=35752 RepID=A0A1I2M4F0_9ACTN|nr:hypothetical protein SAMN05421541_12665 [Actinoplanes philippinensis]